MVDVLQAIANENITDILRPSGRFPISHAEIVKQIQQACQNQRSDILIFDINTPLMTFGFDSLQISQLVGEIGTFEPIHLHTKENQF